MTKIHFILGGGIYPNVVGGMEIFNYYLIKSLRNEFDISYTSFVPLKIDHTKWYKCLNLKPSKVFFPLQVFLHLLFHPQIKKVIISYSEAHWFIWQLYTLIMTFLKIDYYIVIHYGKEPEIHHKKIYQTFFKKAQKVICVSEDIKKNYDKLHNINCRVIYPLVPFERAVQQKEELRKQYNIPINRNVICMIGSVKQMKNPDDILEVIKNFNNEELVKYNPHIVYAGSGNMIEILKKRASDYKISDRVTFLGFVPKEKVNEIYKLSDIYLIASDFEGTSVSLLEAMFNAMPIIASRVPGIIDTISEEKESIMYSLKSHIELKAALIKILSNSDLKNEIKNNAFKHYSECYSYKNVLKEYKNILTEN